MRALLLLLTLVTALPLSAQTSRDSLALALLRFEYVVRDAAAGSLSRADLNGAFDRASLGFFMGQGATAGALLDSVSRSLTTPATLAGYATAAQRALTEATAAVRWVHRGTDSVPYLIALPASAAPAPLLVALHGAGGDERMFFTAYGAGRLQSEATGRGMIVITPNSTAFAAQPWALDSLVAVAARLHAVDRGRLYLLGHSMGAGIASQRARTAGDRIAAVACLAMACGGGVAVPGRVPPLFSRTGALDPIAPAGRAEAAAASARSRGEVVDYATLPDEGHTQMVGPLLPAVLDWLLGQRLP
jgi:predicted esterase